MVTPNFDRLASKGVIFANAHVQQAVCGPSRASVLTATYPDHNKVWDLQTNFRISFPELISMPQYLKNQGYITMVSGKKIFHNGSTSPGHDSLSWSIPYKIADQFDPKFGRPAAGQYHNDSLKSIVEKYYKEAISQGKTDQESIDWYAFQKIRLATEQADVSDEGYEDGVYTAEVISKLKSLAKSKKPFFYAIGFSRPHLPFNAPKKYWDLYDRKKIVTEKFQALVPETPEFIYHNFGELKAYNDIDKNYSLTNKIPEAKQIELIHGYMACVSYIDAQLGKILDAVENSKLSKNTIIVLWGDHGFHLGDHALWCKHSNFEQATRIPFMFSGPGIAKNRTVNQPVELIDLFPTLLDLVGFSIPRQVDGISLKNLLDDNPKTMVEKDFAMSQYPRPVGRMGYTIRTERYRYTVWFNNHYNAAKPYEERNIEFEELYDYATDPLETTNRASDKKYEPIKRLSKTKLINHLTQLHKKLHSD
jgi:arylsulfatase A-like enzyme